MINYIIVDDDELQIDFLQLQLENIDELYCLAVCTNALDARKKIIAHNPDLLILDIEMPDLTGIQLVKSMKEVPAVIFVTSHTGYAIDAFDVEAIDYITKPVAPERLIRAIDKVKKQKAALSLHVPEAALSFDTDAFFTRDKNTYIKTSYKDVLYIESSGNFSFIHTLEGNKQIVLANLAKMEEQMPGNLFIRISRSFIINKQYVRSINTEQIQVQDTYLNIGKQYAEKVLTAIIGKNVIKRK
ncbi:MAG: response regulator transcription factor [Sphingobacteriales bacterium]|nr:MAG: response regulator transcription factor [Sphingobacteriales bacterium]